MRSVRLAFHFLLSIGLFCAASAMAQEIAPAVRITQSIDEQQLTTLKGTVSPLATAANDRGAAADDLKLDRIKLILRRSAEQETALRQRIAEMHTPGSSHYHQWLTPDQFGKQFGASDEDIATLQNWLATHGFTEAKVNPGKQTLEFSGNVAQFRSTFHAQIRKFEVKGQLHTAIASDPQIPAALTPLVGGFASLDNFPLKSHSEYLGKAQYNPKTDHATADWTIGSASTGYIFALAPQDFWVQYDLNSLYHAGVNGAGQTIAIVNESNIDVALVNSFRSLFGLPYNPPQVILDGNDPGVDGINNPDGGNGASVEAYLDVEWAGAVAPNATIDLVIGADTALENGLYLALEHAVYGNVAPIVSLSFGECEAQLGSTNQFLSSLYEQAAAQGITVLVSTGDSGSANCDGSGAEYATLGQAVNGLASTPFNVAVGGTDFYYSDYDAGSSALNSQITSYWSLTPSNSAPAVSLQGVIPEQPWNNSQYGLNLANLYTETDGLLTTIAGGGGGASNSALCSNNTYNSSYACTGTVSGYAKPAWQSGSGVPSDGVRDLPDVSLFAANGYNSSFYPICYYDGDCQPVASGQTVQITGVGGTSASTPAFAGIMALVNQQYGRQGQAGYVLYPLAAQFPTSFHDVTVGSNSVPCPTGSTDCIPVSNALTIDKIPGYPAGGTIVEGEIGTGTTADYNAGPGYDLASGLGTIDAAKLVNNWNKVAFTSTKTTLTPNETTFAHATKINISGSVTATGGTPTGDVALMTDSDEPLQQGQTLFTLNNGSFSADVSGLPGGTYNIWGQYGGDSANGMSTSVPVKIDVSPEASTTIITAENLESYSGPVYVLSGTTNVTYGTDLVFYAQPSPSSTSSKTFTLPTGTVTFTDNGTAIATVALNSNGLAELDAPWSLGNHSVIASYSGDQSYSASNSGTFTFGIVKQTATLGFSEESPAGPPDPGSGMGTAHLTIQAVGSAFNSNLNTAQPTGTVTISSSPAAITGSAALIPSIGQSVANFFIQAPPGSYSVTVSYSGDANYSATTQTVTPSGNPITISAPGALLASTTNVTASGSISPTTFITVSGTVTGQNGSPAPTGLVFVIDAGITFSDYLLVPGPGDVSTFSFVLNSQKLSAGNNFLTFVYAGDTVYNASLFALANPITNPLSDFTMTPNSSIVPLAAGGSSAETINLASVNGFSGAIALTCTAPSGITCTIPSTVSLVSAGTATASATIGASSITSPGSYNVQIVGTDSTGQFVHSIGLTARVGTAGSAGFRLSNSGNISVNAGDTSNDWSTLMLTSANGFSGAVALSCAVTTSISTPSDPPTCILSVPSVSVSSAISPTVVLVVRTTAATNSVRNLLPAFFWPSTGGTALALLLFFRVPRRRGWLAALGAALLLAVSIACVGCGGSSGSSSNGGGTPGTTAGTYTVTVTGTAGSLVQTTAVTVNVK